MKIITAMYSDIGTRKDTNQDSACITTATYKYGTACLALICDGMGGLEKGELASATVIQEFDRWFRLDLPKILNKEFQLELIREQWNRLIFSLNMKISQYGKEQGIRLGTTITGVLLINEHYICGNVGDSRLYQLSDTLIQVTKDHTIVARDIEVGRITKEEAKVDPRRNVLLQCIGASNYVKADYFTGSLQKGQMLLLCSDGFRHEVTEEEIYDTLSKAEDERLEEALRDLTELNMKRGEKDNITSVIIKRAT